MQFINDASTQNGGSLLSFSKFYSTKTNPSIKLNSNSGIYNPSDNVIKIFTNNTDAFTIDASQVIAGNGGNITNINYNNISSATKPDLTVYATNTNFNNLSTTVSGNTTSINNNNTSINSINTSINSINTSVNNINATSTTIFNSLSSYITTTNANALNSRFFNNNGNIHGNITDFNSVSQFGYNFIMGTTNGPGVNGAAQYYSWDIGLGANYGFGTYKAQFALPRNSTNPYLCVRYQENTSFGGWQKLSSAYADSAGSIAYANVTGTPDLTGYATITNLNTKENTLTFSAPLTRTTNTISLDLSLYDTIALRNTALSSYLTSALASTTYATITNLNTKENALTFSAPLTRTTNTISIDLSSYLTSAYAATMYATVTSQTVGLLQKESVLTFSAPLTRTTNTISLDLSAYDTIALRNTALSSYLTSATAATTYATITNLNTKENALTFSAPLTRTTNTISIDLSSYVTTATAATYATITSLTTGLATKQATLTFSNPFLNSSNTLSLKYDNTKLGIDASGNLTVLNSGQWTTSGTIIFYNGGNVGIGTSVPLGKLTIRNGYSDGANGGLCLDANDGSVYNFKLYSFVQGGGQVGYNFQVNNQSSSVNALTLGYNGNIGIKTTNPQTALHISAGDASVASFGPNSSFTTTLNIGSVGNSYASYGTTTNRGAIVMTATNLHIDSATNGHVYINYFNSSMYTYTNNRLVHSGYMGVNVDPSYPFHVNTSAVYATVTNGLIYNSGTYLSTQTYGRYISIKAENSIWTADYFIYSSDERIKKNIRDINDDIALQKLLLIQPKLYNYIDVTRQGENDVIGFIAQQVAEVEPLAVTTQSDFIPNIYKPVDIVDDIFYLEQDIFKVNDEIQIWDLEGTKKSYKIINVIGNYITINEKIKGEKCFVYGSKVDDFKTLNKDYIYTLNVSATQELYKLIQQQNLIIQDLQTRISILENKNI